VHDLAVLECPKCGERTLDGTAVDRVDKARARAFNLLGPEDIVALRRRLDLSQAELADLLGLGAKTLTRWETGQLAPSRAMNSYLRLFDILTRDPASGEQMLAALAPAIPLRAARVPDKVRRAIRVGTRPRASGKRAAISACKALGPARRRA